MIRNKELVHSTEVTTSDIAVVPNLLPSASITAVRRLAQRKIKVTDNYAGNHGSFFLLVGSIFVIIWREQVQCMQQLNSRSIRRSPTFPTAYTYFLAERRKRTCPWNIQSPQHSIMTLFDAKKSSHSSSQQKPNKRYAGPTSPDNKPYKSNTNSPTSSSSSSSSKRMNEKNRSQKDAMCNPSPLVSTLLSFQNDIFTILEKQPPSTHIQQCTPLLYHMMETVQVPSSYSTNIHNNTKGALDEDERFQSSRIIDETIQHILQRIFYSIQDRKKSSSTKNYWKIFMEALHFMNNIYAIKSSHSLQNIVSSPFHLISTSTIRLTLRTLNSLILQEDSTNKKIVIVFDADSNLYDQEADSVGGSSSDRKLIQSCLSLCYRYFQRWVTGYGIRRNDTGNSYDPVGAIEHSTTENESWRETIQERDISILLNAFVILGDMNTAQRVIALQERSDVTPPLSPVAYSILIKGYGRLRDTRGIDEAIIHARRNNIQPDIIMCNGMIDAFINCGDIERAYDLFSCISQTKKSWNKLNLECRPNVRTFNTMLKGFAKTGNLQQSMILFNNLKRNRMFDAVTVNTLVSVAVSASSYHIAESLLLNYTEPSNAYPSDSKTFHQHPNVEAYTELIDGYGKAGKLSEAVQLLQTMRTRGVKPNEITYTSIIGALSRHRRIKQAKDMLQFMQTVDRIRPGGITFNAMISGLLGSSASVSGGSLTRDEDYDLSPRIDTAMEIYTTMSHCGVKPNGITISTIINALSRCQPSRFTEALQILIKAEEAKVIRRSDFRVGTSMIRAYASIGDVGGCLETYNNLEKRDLISFNVLLDSLCRCGKIQKALLIFSQSSSKKAEVEKIIPDVITYSILIGELLKVGSKSGSKSAVSNVRKLYKDMKSNRDIMPDCGLIEIILSGMMRGGSVSLDEDAIRFVRAVLKDAKMVWSPGEYKKRAASFNSIFLGTLSEKWKESDDEEDPLFRKKKWNKIDSGFQLWGKGQEDDGEEFDKGQGISLSVDDFLSSKKWNDFDSGFRLI